MLRTRTLTAALALGLLGACQQTKSTVVTSPTAGTAETQVETNEPALAIANPVLAGDFPDPSITKVGDTYWATATSSNWGPVFPLLKSTNLKDWELAGHVFPNELPAWADYYFWAPEISQEGDKTYIYYTAHKKGGNLAVGVAVADNPAGPYRDLGPLVGQEVGSIDGFAMRDEKGDLYLIWKEDGNSRNLPTPIWAQRLNEEHTALLGEKKELFRNTAPWEGNLVEGVAMVKRNDYFYAFYAANGCCGHNCTYGTGVARAKSLLGPWEKYEKNPILTKNDKWACPGHGTVFNRGNRWYMLHHAYDTRSFEFVGRQGVVSEFTWTAEGWPEFTNNGSVPVQAAPVAKARNLTDEFDGPVLQPSWQWPVQERPTVAVRGGQLRLTARPEHSGAALGQHTTSANYTATTTLLNPNGLPAGTVAGIAAHGDPENTLALTAGSGKLQLWQLEKGKQKTLSETKLPTAAALTFRLRAENGNLFRFDYSTDNGKNWLAMPAAGAAAINGTYLPPWDRGVRAGVLAKGPVTATATFERFELDSQ
ncbi:family 43 glycosylhydrolase [Hymenobacter sp. BT186]|uniref:Family 43 glycosylhydrolase n=1 Tax=Hymenobacter telluris TaxID=2816474 RepID=A0A939JFL2_9BACT|nr:family 43 glycosylhydrolase [Hymenobacter telluris]MBO0361138.1 family 43 glycosylhydrolase [Hymenobacter telluris]MBW3377166.1 family 43 glycosylhydrolase [Hymenobacter norwichensis]